MNPLFKNQNQTMISKFAEFKQMMSGKNPSDMLNNLMNSGKYTNEQLNQAKQMAEQFKSILK